MSSNQKWITTIIALTLITPVYAIALTLTYTVENDGLGGTLEGETVQNVPEGGNGTPVTAVPDEGYEFISWSDRVSDNPRTDTNVMSDIEVAASFQILAYDLFYTAGEGGTLEGETIQAQIEHGNSGTAVTAVPDEGYQFVNWSDGSTQNPRTDATVTSAISVTANFSLIEVEDDEPQQEESRPGGNSSRRTTNLRSFFGTNYGETIESPMIQNSINNIVVKLKEIIESLQLYIDTHGAINAYFNYTTIFVLR